MHIVYKTTNLINGNYYIGVHKSFIQEFDGYLGSGIGLKRAIKKYGTENFIRETLFSYDNVEDAYEKEIELVLPVYKNKDCYNMRPGGRGIRNVKINNHTKEWRENQSKLMTGRKPSAETVEKLRKIDRSYMHTPEYKEKLSKAKRGKPNPHNPDIVWPRAKRIKTPLGTYNSMVKCALAHGISRPTVKDWANKNINGFSFVKL